MLNIDRVRGVMRAKYGSQIPKFENPASPLPKPNPNSLGSMTALPKMQITNNPIGALRELDMQKFTEYIGKNANRSNIWKKNKAAMAAQGLDYTKSKTLINLENFALETGNVIDGLGDKIGDTLGNIVNDDSLFGIASLLVDTNVDINSKGMNTAMELVDTINPAIGFGLRTINKLGSKTMPTFQINKLMESAMGGGYGGSFNFMKKKGEDMSGKEVGFFTSSSGIKKGINQSKQLHGRIMGIYDDSLSRFSMINNPMNANRQLFLNNGGFNFKLAARLGGKLDDKINLVKSRKFNLVINVDTKLVIEWEPVITEPIEEFRNGGVIEWEPVIEDLWEPIIEISEFLEGGKLEKSSFEDWFNSIPENNRANQYDYKKAYEVFDWEILSKHAKDPENNHLYSVSPIADENGNYPFLKLGKIEDNPEIQGEFDWYNSEEGKEHKSKFDIEYINDRYYYVPKKFKEGGKTKEELETPKIEETSLKNLIPEGALHKNKHHMEHTEGLTLKGIPVIDNDGEQQAEIELDEIIFTLEVTKKLEELYKEGTDEAAIEAGKLLVKEILFNTDDRTDLIAKCKEGGKL